MPSVKRHPLELPTFFQELKTITRALKEELKLKRPPHHLHLNDVHLYHIRKVTQYILDPCLPPCIAQRGDKLSKHVAFLRTIPELCKRTVQDASWPPGH